MRTRVSEPAPTVPPERPARAARSSGGKDRHSKVNTAKGPRDRRVRLSVPTAVQFYDVQDRLGYDQPSKAVEWLIKHAKAAIDELAQLPPVRQGEPAPEPQPQTQPQQQPQQQRQQPQQQQQQTSSASTFSVLPTPSLIDSSGTSYGNYESSHRQPAMVSAPFVQGMEPLGPPYGQVPVDPNFAREAAEGIFRSSSSDVGRAESRAKARERARERAKEKQYTDPDPGRGGYGAPAPQYANLPSQVSSALQHPFQPPFAAPGNNQPGSLHRQAPSYPSYFPEAFSSPPFGGYPPEPSPSSFISVPQSHASVSQYFVDNPPGAMGGRYGITNPNFPGFSPASSLRPSPFSSLLSDPGYNSGSPYFSSMPYPNPPRPSSSLLGQPRLSHGTVYPQAPSSHLVRPGHDNTRQTIHSTPHSLDPNFYNPQMSSSLQGFEELEEEFKP